MRIPKILITVRDGVVQGIVANDYVDIMLVDWDNIDQGDDLPEDFDYPIDVATKIHPLYKDADYRREGELYQLLKDLDI